MDPLDPLFHRCADSSHLYNVLMLVKSVLRAYHSEEHGSESKRNSIKRWTVLKGKVSRLIDLQNVLPGFIVANHPLSVASFETTASVYYYKALLRIAEEFPVLVNAYEDFDSAAALTKVEELFPQHYQLEESENLFVMHEVKLLATLWSEKIETNPELDTTPLESAINKLQKIAEHEEMQKGILLILWQQICSPKVSALVSMMEKSRKMPKPRMLQRTIGMKTSTSIKFVQFAREVLMLLFNITSGK
eukprot:CAMPEP_0206205236 /NCGR_PEP_ID=MMETSP0166-20121206/14081_1 /ASSEMBLY_ACC=CAM_ASM_000260 /TAXON_ID=95228 /ORGANISM="Vannella robusta, Strain DIVA3 518/3/11/1/6" /LENGTH=246 /DNA_ID=CAMNT_0053625179 /DNA_START=156 /DNA_END=893 /DNA_ORIENTATION=-